MKSKIQRIGLIVVAVCMLLVGLPTTKTFAESKESDKEYDFQFDEPIKDINIEPIEDKYEINKELNNVSSDGIKAPRAGETIEYINNEADLITLLNTHYVAPGKEYTLTRDMEINASDLDPATVNPIPGDVSNVRILTTGSFQSSFNGQNFKIKVNVDTAAPSRVLFSRINGPYTPISDTRVPITFKDLSIQYTGDVEGYGFAMAVIATDVENVHVLVQDDLGNKHGIVPTESLYGDISLHYFAAYGFTDDVDGVRSLMGGLTKQTYLKDISITAGTIGTPIGTPEAQANMLETVSGFSRLVAHGVSIEDVEINVENLYAMSNIGSTVLQCVVTGFTDFLNSQPSNGKDYVKNIKIDVAQNIEHYEITTGRLGFSSQGIFGFFAKGSSLDDSSLHVGGDVIARVGEAGGPSLTYDNGSAVHLIGGADWASYGLNKGSAQYKGLDVKVDGDVKSLCRGQSVVLLGVYGIGQTSKYSSEDITVEIGGDVIAKRSGSQLVGGGATDSTVYLNLDMNDYMKNNKFIIGGDIIVDNDDQATVGGDAGYYGHRVRNYMNPSNGNIDTLAKIEGNEVQVNGDVKVNSKNGSAYLFGLFYGKSMETTNNVVKYLGDVEVTSSAPANGEAIIAGYTYVDGGQELFGATPMISERKIDNNFVYFGGDVKAKGVKKAFASGFISGISDVGLVTNNIVRIDGEVSANTNNTTKECASAGFAIETDGEVTNNAVYVKDATNASTTTGNTYTGAFTIEIGSGAKVEENTVLGRAGKYNATDPLSYYETFADSVDVAATVNDNFYTSLLGGQRVVNTITYNAGTQDFSATQGVQPLTQVTATNDFTGTDVYLNENNNGTFTFKGSDASSTSLSGNNLTSASAIPAVATTVSIGGKDAVIDLPGIGHPYTNNKISGNIFDDINNNGLFDGSDAYLVGESIIGKVNGTKRMGTTTDANGDYTMNVPLLSCFHENEYVFSWDTLDTSNYNWSNHAANDFSTSGTITKKINYLDDIVYQGIVRATSYTINYYLDGGLNASSNPITYIVGSGVTSFAAPTKTGYSFGGWYADALFTTPITSISTTQTGVVDVYAKWNVSDYTINYYLDGGTNDGSNPSTYTYGVGVTSFAVPTKTGYSFGGWYADALFTTPLTSISTTQTGVVNVYAKWDGNSYNITYHIDGGTNDGSNPLTYVTGTGVASFVAPTKTGYAFKGWYKEASFTTLVTSISNTQTGAVDLYAKWEANNYTITYHLDGGVNVSSNPSTYTFETGVASFKAPTKVGYTFNGWYKEATFTTPITSISTTQTGNVNMYAKWTVNAKTLTIQDDFKANDNILVVYRSGDTKETSILFPSGYSYEYDIKLNINGSQISTTELKDVTWNVDATGNCSDKLTYVSIQEGTNKLVAKRTGVVTLSATYKGSTAKIDVVIPGDVTRDGVLNTADAMRIQKYVSAKTVDKNNLGVNDKYTELMADLNGDGIINTADKLVIQKMVSKVIKPSN